uniref:Uncharacterized protein n=1 Tax=Hemiselmis tepida TaxID=464990 RepID=A0A7S0VGN6_9CRYP
MCSVPSESCKALGVRENLCGECEALPGGKKGFRLYNPGGITFDGYTFDDSNNGPGSQQVLNVCMLARYGNKGDYGAAGAAKATSLALTARGTVKGPHFYGACSEGGCGACSNNGLLPPGADWRMLAIGNSCNGDHDLDRAWAGVECHF